MTTFRIEIVADPTGTVRGNRVARREFERTERTADRLRGAISRAFAFVGIGLGIREVASLSDEFTNYQNRLRTVTDGTEELAFVTDELFRIANDTRLAYGATAEVYARTGLAAQDLGKTQEELLQFTESLNQAVALSGASATEANAGLIQLSQGLASGALRGEELNSVLEQLPVVADVIADSLGVTRGELRELGSEGAISADIVLNAFAAAREELAGRFGEAVPTIAGAFTILRNNVLQYVGAQDQANGFTERAVVAIRFLAENVDTIARVATFAGTAFAIDFAARGIGSAISGLNSLRVALLANPLTALPALLTLAAAGFIAFGDAITIAEGKTTTLQDVGTATLEELTSLTAGLGDTVEIAFSQLNDELGGVFDEIDLSLQGILTTAAVVTDRTLGLFTGTGNALIALFQGIPLAVADFGIQAINGLITLVEAGLDGSVALIDGFAESTFSVGRAVFDLFRELDAALGLLLKGETEAAAQFAGDAIETFGNRVQRTFLDFDNTVASSFAQLNGDQILPQFENSFEGGAALLGDAVLSGFLDGLDVTLVEQTLDSIITRADDAAEAGARAAAAAQGSGAAPGATPPPVGPATDNQALVAQNEALEFQQAILESIRQPQQDFLATQDALNALLDSGAISAEEYAFALNDAAIAANTASTSVSQGLAAGLAEIQNQINDTSGLVANSLVSAFNSAEDAFVSFVTTGEADFKGLVDGILSDLARLLARQGLQALLGSFGGGGAAGGLLGNLFGGFRAEGGPVNPDQAFIVGERGPELFTPESAGNITPAGETAALFSQSQQAPVVNVPAPQITINNITDPSEIDEAIQGPGGVQAVTNVVRRNAKKFRSLLSV